jgi:hypothetical protein
MKKIIENGIIGYFDILGYQNFLINNPLKYCVEVIEDVLIKIPEEIKDDRFAWHGRSNDIHKDIEEYFKNHCNITFISDTIIFFFDFDSIEDVNLIPIFLHQILVYLLFFQKNTFEEGFPMRGCMDYGSFYYNNKDNKNIIAGETIINCYHESNNLNFSGLVMTDKLYDHYKRNGKKFVDKIFDKKIVDKYLVNTKIGECKKYLVNFILDFQRNDLRQYIFECFSNHNKEINDNVMEKIYNTEKTMRYFIYNNDKYFE